jgi:uridylate kinase
MKYVIRQLALVVFLLSLAGPVFAAKDDCKTKKDCAPASVPEIDAGSGASAIALLLGGGALLRERLQRRPKAPLV